MRALLLALTLAGSSTGQRPAHSTVNSMGAGLLSPVVFSDTFARTGALIPDDANTVAHVYWDGTQLVDTKANAWTMNGTVPQVTGASPLYPVTKNRPAAGNAGAFSDTNYYSVAAGSALSVSGDFYSCFVFTPAAADYQSNHVLLSNGVNAGSGYYHQIGAGGVGWAFHVTTASADRVAQTTNLPTIGQGNIACSGYASGQTSVYAKLNLGPIASNTAPGALSTAAALPSYIGRYNNTTYPFAGTITEIITVAGTPSDAVFTARMKEALSAATGGPYFTEPAGTVSHVTFTGTALVDSKGLAWTQNGTVPQGSASLVYPYGVDLLPRSGAGPFSASNYYSSAVPGPARFQGGTFSVCAAFIPASATPEQIFASQLDANTGWYIEMAGGSGGVNGATVGAHGNGNLYAATTEVPVLNSANIVCGGYDGANLAVKLNLGSYATKATTFTPATATLSQSVGSFGGAAPFTGTLLEVWESTTAPSDALFTKIQNAYFGHVPDKGGTLTVARASTATDVINGHLWTWPSGVLRTDPGGGLFEGGSTNLVLQSGDLSNAAWSKSGGTVTANQAPFADGATTMALYDTTAAANNSAANESFAVAAGAHTYTHSAWASPFAASNVVTVGFASCTAGNTASCTCATDNGTACATEVAAGGCQAYATITTRTRLSCTETCTSANTGTTGYPFLTAGRRYTSVDKAYFGGMQAENQPFATSYIATTTTTTARSADQVSFAEPSGVSITSGPYSVSATGVLAGTGVGDQDIFGSNQNYAPRLRVASGSGTAVDAASDTVPTLATIARTDANKQTSTKYAMQKAGASLTVYAAGAAGSTATLGAQPAEPTTWYLGSHNGGGYLFGTISQVCVAKTSTGCPP